MKLLFSWYIVGYLFLAGAGSGAFFVAAGSCLWDAVRKSEASERLVLAAQAGFYAAPCLTVAAAFLLLLDLGSASRAWQVVVMPFQSIMSVGAWLVALLAVTSGTLALAGLVARSVPKALQWTCCLVGAACALGTMTYTGLLLSDMVSIDFWHTPWLVALFVASSLSTGAAVVIGMDAVFLPQRSLAADGLWRAAAVLCCVEACVLAAFLAVQHGFTETARASCNMLLDGSLSLPFWGGVVLAGLAGPLVVHAMRRLLQGPTAMLAASGGVLVGGFLLRYCIVAAALYTPLALGVV